MTARQKRGPGVPQRILMIAPTSFFSDYGCHVRILEEILVLQQRGHKIVLATYHNGDDLPGIDIRRSWDVPWIKRAMVGSSRHKLYLDIALSWRGLRVALATRPTIIHAHLHEGALIGAVLKRMLRVPLVFDYQGSMTSEMLDHGFLKPSNPLYKPLHWLEQQINQQADAVVTSTFNAAALLRQQQTVDRDRIHTVPDRVNTNRFRPFDPQQDDPAAWEAQRRELRAQLGIPEGRRIVAYLGLLAPYQGTNMLIQAAQQVVARLPDVHFLIMGYPDPASYRAYAESLGIGDHVSLPGRIYYRDAHAYLRLGDVAVAPKMSATEGSGKISNYMAMGLPVVAFDTPVSREMMGGAGLYARLGDADDLAARIIEVLDDPARAANLAAAGRARALSEFAWEQAAIEIEAIYARVLAPAQPAALPQPTETPLVEE
ncbi:MAG: glycosyltransferase family 4 protein [Chloroflexaceae bacterium]|nr:glycosyltransferase family 4 protein [Chloroflexaceae bacterium]NJO06933.1 glycosyltransferase family 4 protein [Chloroflexaceae bacterium]